MGNHFLGAISIEKMLLAGFVALATLLVILRLWRALKSWHALRQASTNAKTKAVLPSKSPPIEPPKVSVAVPLAMIEPALIAPSPKTYRSTATRPEPARPQREQEDGVLPPEALLERAQHRIAAGAFEDAAAQLRLCVRLAAKQKLPAVEAKARMNLGDLARSNGDLTTACEHWQMARSLYTDLKRHAEQLDAEQRMETAGCPTDWVLNQF